jgi:hypothetical protein
LSLKDHPPVAGSNAPLGDKRIWKKIWKCNIPEKVRIFAWKALSNALATEMNKKRRHFPLTGLCQVCGNGQEDSRHALIGCPHATALWSAMGQVWLIPEVPNQTRREDWLEAWLESAPMDM